MRWVLQRSDRTVVAAQIDGRLLGATLAARDLLKAIRFGQRHHARSDAPELPPALIQALAPGLSRQVKLSDKVTARFEPVNEGDSWLPAVGIEFFVEAKPSKPALSRLSPVERDVLERILTGASNKEIAAGRGTRFATVKSRVSAVLGKLGMSSRRELFVPALFASTTAVSEASMTMTR